MCFVSVEVSLWEFPPLLGQKKEGIFKKGKVVKYTYVQGKHSMTKRSLKRCDDLQYEIKINSQFMFSPRTLEPNKVERECEKEARREKQK